MTGTPIELLKKEIARLIGSFGFEIIEYFNKHVIHCISFRKFKKCVYMYFFFFREMAKNLIEKQKEYKRIHTFL